MHVATPPWQQLSCCGNGPLHPPKLQQLLL
jgi:hypothetical protein